MGGFSLIHWIILGIVVLLLFGGNRFSSMMGDVAKGLKSFKQGMAEDDSKQQDPRQLPPTQQQPSQQQYQQPIELTPQPPQPPEAAATRPVSPSDEQAR